MSNRVVRRNRWRRRRKAIREGRRWTTKGWVKDKERARRKMGRGG